MILLLSKKIINQISNTYSTNGSFLKKPFSSLITVFYRVWNFGILRKHYSFANSFKMSYKKVCYSICVCDTLQKQRHQRPYHHWNREVLQSRFGHWVLQGPDSRLRGLNPDTKCETLQTGCLVTNSNRGRNQWYNTMIHNNSSLLLLTFLGLYVTHCIIYTCIPIGI